MTDAAMQAQYTHLDFVPTRKVVKIILEIPIEQADAFIAAFGSPRPDKSVAVAVARLDTQAVARKPGGKLAQRAGIVCGEPGFFNFLNETMQHDEFHLRCAAQPDECIRWICKVKSRAELDHDSDAAYRFNELMRSYSAWQSHG